jgi:hypothetical protein
MGGIGNWKIDEGKRFAEGTRDLVSAKCSVVTTRRMREAVSRYDISENANNPYFHAFLGLESFVYHQRPNDQMREADRSAHLTIRNAFSCSKKACRTSPADPATIVPIALKMQRSVVISRFELLL